MRTKLCNLLSLCAMMQSNRSQVFASSSACVLVVAAWLAGFGCNGSAVAQETLDFAGLQHAYARDIQPLILQFCLDCHSTDDREGELDLERFASLTDVRHDAKAWQKVAEMLDNGEMPPADSPQPNDTERKRLVAWVNNYLHSEALAGAGDPGPVILRRLNNAEYNYTIRDLTHISTLDPTQEFPIDGAAGEGFTNSGSAQSMSPSLVQKYLDAAKSVAEHAVLLPDGIVFSEHTSQRDQTDEWVRRIQAYYAQFVADGGGQAVDLQGIKFDTNQGGVLPLEPYLEATLVQLASIPRNVAEFKLDPNARGLNAQGLNAKYYSILWDAIAGVSQSLDDDSGYSPLNVLRERWRLSKPEDAAALAALITDQQKHLWKYNSIGHVGKEGEPGIWLEAVSPIATSREFNVKLQPDNQEEVSVYLIARPKIGEAKGADALVHWDNARLTKEGEADILLRDLAGLEKRVTALQKEALSNIHRYLDAVMEVKAALPSSPDQRQSVAQKHGVAPSALELWLNYLGVGEAGPTTVSGHIRQKLANETYAFVSGWGVGETPIMLGNSSDTEVRIPGLSRPHSIVAHPSPTLFIAAGWQSPITGAVQVEARLADAHPECGNGQEWFVQHRSPRQVGNLAQGVFGTGGSATVEPKTLSVKQGELISIVLGPRDGNHSCDLTEINLTITEVAGEKRSWDLAKDCSADIQTANPHPDQLGNANVWHFYQGEMAAIDREATEFHSVPAGSLLARWQQESDAAKRAALVAELQKLVDAGKPSNPASPDALLYEQLMGLAMSDYDQAVLQQNVEQDSRFGVHPDGLGVGSEDLIGKASQRYEFRIPATWANGRSFVVTGKLAEQQGDSAVQIEVSTSLIQPEALTLASPFIVSEGGSARKRIEADLDAFRNLFPPTLCYTRIVPVDEVVTLTLFYRQDDHLQRLMLNDDQARQLDRLWDELFYIAQEPLKYQVAFEQIREFATQDRPDLVTVWAPLIKTVDDRAQAFRERLVATQPAHLDALVDFAALAWRHTLSANESASIRELYAELRAAELSHDASVRLVLARILTSPEFLYRHELSPSGETDARVRPEELATRLSYFLWSSSPDSALRHAAELQIGDDDQALAQEARRMLQDSRTRRLAEQFACQWLHIRDFDQNVEKNEKLYPTFLSLRSDMYQESVLFFEDLFRNDRSILSLLDADHLFASPELAAHYGLDWSQGEPVDREHLMATDTWRRIQRTKAHGRGGVLGMATVLASQSGTSRTSPILRGNWVYETLLGERLPRPPAGVPQIPDAAPEGLTARQLIEKHSSDAGCAKCHRKIDPFGFALEQFDTDGSLRTELVDTKTVAQDGSKLEGIEGLREYVLNHRRKDFVNQFCRKLLGYALGREIQLSDQPLLDEIQQKLAQNDYRFSTAVEAIVLSKQFRSIRGQLAEQ
jgi:RNAse (barnase) inhibitor barstar